MSSLPKIGLPSFLVRRQKKSSLADSASVTPTSNVSIVTVRWPQHALTDMWMFKRLGRCRLVAVRFGAAHPPRSHHNRTTTNKMHPRAAFPVIAAMSAVCPTSATVLPLPRLSSDPSNSTSQLTTKMFYQQGLASMNNMHASPGICDALVMATGDLRVGYCEGLPTAAVSISRLQGMECVFMMFRGSAACGVDATEMVSRAGSWDVESLQPLLTRTMSRA